MRMCGEKTFGQLISLRPGRILCQREPYGESDRDRERGREKEGQLEAGSEILAILTATQNVVTVIKTSRLSLLLLLLLPLHFLFPLLSVLALCN